MPDSFEHMPTVAVRMPNGALSSLAGNIDAHHHCAIADLILVQRSVQHSMERLVRDNAPDVLGLSVMTFQRKTAFKIIAMVRRMVPQIKVVVGGYDPSLAPDEYMHDGSGVDFIVRGEGEITFRDLLRALEAGTELDSIPGLYHRSGALWTRNPARPVQPLSRDPLKLPNRSARVLSGYTFLGSAVDVIETSRGCTFDCGFCSIIAMRGRNFHTFDFERVLADIADAKRHGARSLFIVDDNITLNVRRFEELCHAIIKAGHNDVEYLVQGMTSAIAAHGETLAPLMREAGFRYVFLGIENILQSDLDFLHARAKNNLRGSSGENATLRAIQYIRGNDMLVVGGLIVGNPDDSVSSIEANLSFAKDYVDWPYIQHPTPYPGTPMTDDFRARDLVVNDRCEEYDGTTAVVRTEALAAEDIEFLRWRSERWMKVRHVPAVLRHHPRFVMRNWPKMLAHTFRGSSWRSVLGLEDDRMVFARYKRIRERERTYL
jgi:radical SAM superfamily enzyme YgiQ (UPF0313 family)